MLLVLIFSVLTVRSQVIQLDSGLVAYYPFNGNAIDESGNGNNGTINGAMLTDDRFGNENSAFCFDGISDNIKVPDSDILDIISEISIAGWLNKDSDTAWASMVTKGGEFGEENNYTIHNNTDGGIIFTSYNESGTGGGICNSEIVIPINEWHFVAFTWDGNYAKIYIDGILDVESVTEMPGVFLANNSSLFISVDYPGDTEFFHGYLDDIRIYNRWLNEEEIEELYTDVTNVNKLSHSTVYKIKLSPNPFSNKTTIKFSNPNHSKYKLSVFSISGNKVFEKDNIASDKIEFERRDLKPGIYVVEMKGEKVFRGKMVVK